MYNIYSAYITILYNEMIIQCKWLQPKQNSSYDNMYIMRIITH
jgi:hypothetical protein